MSITDNRINSVVFGTPSSDKSAYMFTLLLEKLIKGDCITMDDLGGIDCLKRSQNLLKRFGHKQPLAITYVR